MLMRRYRPLFQMSPFADDDLVSFRNELSRLWNLAKPGMATAGTSMPDLPGLSVPFELSEPDRD